MYGGLHLLASWAPFNSKAQRIMWLSSVLVLIGPLVINMCFVALLLLRFAFWHVIRSPHRVLAEPDDMPLYGSKFTAYARMRNKATPVKRKLFIVGVPFFRCCLAVYVAAYVLARVYIVVESLISLAYLPDDVYKTPDWSGFLPHIGSA